MPSSLLGIHPKKDNNNHQKTSIAHNSGHHVSHSTVDNSHNNIKNTSSFPSNIAVDSSSKSKTEQKKPYKIQQFQTLLEADNVDIPALRKVAWNGVPSEFRTKVWQLLLGYLPTNKMRRIQSINRKRKEYLDSIQMYYNIPEGERSLQESKILHQIVIDLPRTLPDLPFFQQKIIQNSMERILYVWSIRHPASGYVQGMNDLLTPMIYICLYPFVEDVWRCDAEAVDSKIMMDVEADSYWCLTKLLDNIQDHYTSSQPGLQRMVLRLEDLVHRMDNDLHVHFQNEGIEYLQFAFRWMNCFLLRELPLKVILRIWDTYISEEKGGFENFHVYVCVVLLKEFKEKLMKMPFQDILLFLQEPPTSDWNDDKVEPILSQAFVLSTLFDNSPSHLN